jgi:hypothetical protein
VVVSVLTPAEILIAVRRLAGARPHLAAVAGIVHPEDLWQLCRDELTGLDVHIDGWDIRGRWFGVVVGATPRTVTVERWLLADASRAWLSAISAATGGSSW